MINPIELKIYIVNSKWEHSCFVFKGEPLAEAAASTKTPSVKAEKVSGNIYNVDKITELKEKIYYFLSIPPERQHLRGLTVPFSQWLKSNQNIKDVNIPLLSTSKFVGAKSISIGPSVTKDNTWPTLFYKNRKLILDNPLYQPKSIKINGVPVDKRYDVLRDIEIDDGDILVRDFAPLGEIVLIDLFSFIPDTHSHPSISGDAYTFELVYYGFIIKYYSHMTQELFHTYLRGRNRDRDRDLHNSIENKIKKEDAILGRNKPRKLALRKLITYSVLEVAPPHGPNINLRNLFDKINIGTMSSDLGIQMAQYIMPFKMKKIQLKKYKVNSTKIKIPYDLKNGLVLALSSKQYVNIRDDGGWTIRAQWRDEDEMSQDKIIKENIKVTNKIIDYINTKLVFFGKNPINKIKTDNSKFIVLSENIYWDTIISSRGFRSFRQSFNDFTIADFSESKQTPLLEVFWKKGAIKRCSVRVIHRVTDVKIEIIETNDRDIDAIEDILINFLNGLDLTEEVENSETQRLVKRLREQDPKLYDGLKGDLVYSKQCQGIRQPVIITEKEYKDMANKKEVTTYWNFTKNKPAYYTCQKDPATGLPLRFGFLTGIHKNDWCVPCCKTRSIVEGSKHYEKHNICMRDRKYIEEKQKEISRYILVPFKQLEQGRLGQVPQFVTDIAGEGLYVYGVDQNIPAIATGGGLVYAISEALDLTVEEFITAGSRVITNPNLVVALKEIFVNKVDFYDWDEDWIKLLIDITLEAFDRNVVIFQRDKIRARMNLSQKILIQEFDDNFYPIFKMDPIEYHHNKKIKAKIFESIPEIDILIPEEARLSLTKVLSKIPANVAVEKLFINMNNRCYGMMISDHGGSNGSLRQSFIPVAESPLVSKISLEYGIFRCKDYALSFDLTNAIIKELDVHFSKILIYNNKVIALQTADFINFYIEPLDKERLPQEYQKIPAEVIDINYEDVNEAIASRRPPCESHINDYSEGYYNHVIYKLIKIEILHLIDKGLLKFEEARAMTPMKLASRIPHVIKEHAKMTENIIVSCETFHSGTDEATTGAIHAPTAQHNVKKAKGDATQKVSHCDGVKLIVPPNFIEFIELVLQEMNDPIVNFVEANLTNIVISELEFERHKGEKIEKNIIE